jgi:hypothetical protein
MDTNAQVQEGILSEPSMESEPPFGRWRPEGASSQKWVQPVIAVYASEQTRLLQSAHRVWGRVDQCGSFPAPMARHLLRTRTVC